MIRRCENCGRELVPVKNGFLFVRGNEVRTSDLWGCRQCKRFQIYGIPKQVSFEVGVVGEHAQLIDDPGNPSYHAILYSPTKMPSDFAEHMKNYYSSWDWKEEDLW